LKIREKFLAFFGLADSDWLMIRGNFLGEKDRKKLIALSRDGSAASRVTRRANALVLLDAGWSCQEVADALLLDDDPIRGWRKLFEHRGMEGLTSFDMGGSASFLGAAQGTGFEGLGLGEATAYDAASISLNRIRVRAPAGRMIPIRGPFLAVFRPC
jgi:hypothetical protein